MDFSIDPQTQELLLEQIQDLVERELYPLETDLETNGIRSLLPKLNEVRGQVRELGFWCPHISREHGGMGLSLVQHALVSAVLGRCQLGHYAFNCQAPDAGNMEILIKHGTPEQKRALLEPLLEGRIRSCFAMTEPERPGIESDLDGDQRGQRRSGLRHQRAQVVYQRRRRSQLCHRHGGDRRPGRSLRSGQYDPGPHGHSGISEAAKHPYHGSRGRRLLQPCGGPLRGLSGSPDNLLGVEGAGFRIAQQRLGAGRIHHCMRWIGIGERSIELMCRRAADRELAPGRLLGSRQIVQTWIADSWTEVRAARLMVLDAAWKMERDGQLGARKEISAIKFYAANVLLKVLDRAIQAHGGLGVTSDTPLAGFFRHERAGRIYDGPDEVHRIVVARELLKEYGVKVTF